MRRTIQFACAAVVVLTLMNFFGVVLGKWVQNILVLVKLAGLALIVVAGVMAWQPDAFHVPSSVACRVRSGTYAHLVGSPALLL